MRLYRFIICLAIGISLHISVATSVWAQYGQSAPKIEIAVVASTALTPQNSIDGRIVASHDLAIVAAIDGVVTLGAWREGDIVGKNDLIAEQDTAKIAMALDRLLLQQAETEQLIRQIRTALGFERALLDLAKEQTILQKARRDRLTELAAENVIPKDRLDEALRTYLQSRQAEIQAQKTLAKLESDLVQTQIKSELIAVEIADARADIQSARLIAPASGQLASMTVLDTGYFRQGEMIAQLRSPESYEIEVDVPVALLGFLRQSQNHIRFRCHGR
jgi:multidrug resistance efflux pump